MTDNLKEPVQEAASRFWDNYINILIDQGVKDTARRWYVRRVEQYIQHYADQRLRTHTAQFVVDFFTEIGREGRLSDWQFRQTVDAIRILFCDLLQSGLCSEVDWEYWLESSKCLTPTHATLAREPVVEGAAESYSQVASKNNDVAALFPTAMPRLIAEIRQLGHSIRTERSYGQWVKRFLAFQGKIVTSPLTSFNFIYVENTKSQSVLKPVFAIMKLLTQKSIGR